MVPNDQMSIAHITQTVVAAQVMQLVEAGELNLDDLAADRLPPGLRFDTNGASIADLLSHRSGFPDTLLGPGQWESLTTDRLHAWTPEEVLATVGPERTPVGQNWEFVGTNYVWDPAVRFQAQAAGGVVCVRLRLPGARRGSGLDVLDRCPHPRTNS
jgi:D-alanyl-D-alanine carboxypeptidase